MKYLLDVNALLAAIIQNHSKHLVTDQWLRNKQLVTCPLSELGFLRVSTHPKAYKYSMSLARQALEAFVSSTHAEFAPADLAALSSKATKSEAVTDTYLADLAAAKGYKLATLDSGIQHPAVVVIQ